MDIISLNKYVSLNEDIFPWTNWYGSLIEMNIISCQNIIASNDYTFVNKYMLIERINISLTINKYIIFLKVE